MSTAVAGRGLEGIVAANSGICWIDGEAGVLSYRGIDIHELAVKSTFEETTYLLWNGMLPNELACCLRYLAILGLPEVDGVLGLERQDVVSQSDAAVVNWIIRLARDLQDLTLVKPAHPRGRCASKHPSREPRRDTVLVVEAAGGRTAACVCPGHGLLA